MQLRDKVSDTVTMIARARALKDALARFGVPLIVNDRVDVALAAQADGVHVGQEDMAVEEARRMLGPAPFIGLSIRTVAQAAAAPLALLDYVGIGKYTEFKARTLSYGDLIEAASTRRRGWIEGRMSYAL